MYRLADVLHGQEEVVSKVIELSIARALQGNIHAGKYNVLNHLQFIGIKEDIRIKE